MSSEFRSVLLLAALAQEESALLECLARERPGVPLTKCVLNAALGLEMTTADLGPRQISILKTGIGSVNAGVALALANAMASAAFARGGFDAVILLGVGGALRPELDVGDLVISSRVLQHDYFYSFDHGDQRIRPGALILSSAEAEGHAPEMDADPRLVAWIEKSGWLHAGKEKIFVGAVLSGNEFVGTVARKRAIAQLHEEAWLVEMEAAGVAQVATRLGIPFVIAKTVADRLCPDGTIEADFRACLVSASAHAAAALQALL